MAESAASRGGPPGAGRLHRASRWLALLAGLALLGACRDRPAEVHAMQVPGGDPSRAPALMHRYGCVSCHVIPGVRGARSLVGPPLSRWSHRVYIAGLLPNTPENLVAWLQNPQAVHPGSAMPDMGVTPEDAVDIAAYLYGLR